MAKTQFLNYDIVLTDKARVAELQGQVHAGGVVGRFAGSPVAAAALYTPNPGVPLGICYQDEATFAPSLQSPWFGTSTNHSNYPLDEASFTRTYGSWWGFFGTLFPWLIPGTTKFYWFGNFVYGGPQTDETGVPGETAGVIAQRRWIDGAELSGQGEGGTGTGENLSSRGASRHLQGFGYGFKSSTLQRAHMPIESGLAATSRQWERLYIRTRRFPAAASTIWRCRTSTSNNCGVVVQLMPNGTLAIHSSDLVNTLTLIGTTTTPLTMDVWKKLDIIYSTGLAAGGATFGIYVDGVIQTTIAPASLSGGLSNNYTLASVEIGNPAANTAVYDIDDWIGAGWPDHFLNPTHAPGIDWLNGSYVALVQPNGFAASHESANWVGDWALARQRTNFTASAVSLTTSTASARLAMTTDAKQTVDREQNALGIAALTVARFGSRAGSADGQIGYTLPGAVEVLSNITESSSVTWEQGWYHPSGLVDPITPLEGLELSYVRGAAATAVVVRGLFAVVEIIGAFGPEDVTPHGTDPTPTLPPAMAGIHNAPYPRTPWARLGQASQGLVSIIGGTYVGNNTATVLNFRAPIHYLVVRNTSSHAGFEWCSSAIGPHDGGDSRVLADLMPVCEIDYTFVAGPGVTDQQQQTRVRLPGTNIKSNANGITYQYIAFSDAAMRFMLAGALTTHVGADAFVTALFNEAFTPEVGFFFKESPAATAAGNEFYKGIGHSADAISPLSATETASAIAFGTGTVTYKSGFTATNLPQATFALWRRHDGNNDPGEPGVLWLLSYIGDGSASRTLSFAPTSGLRPLYAVVVPHNAASVRRDPTHTGTTSTTFPATSNASTGITAGGIDSISVGSALNASGITYDVFVFPGSTTAGNNGWSINGEFVPVAPDSPVDGPWDPTPADPEAPEPTTPPVEPAPTDPGGGGPGDEPNFSLTCKNASMQIINRALSHLGVSKRVLAIATDMTAEASEARLHYSEDVDATLRAFAWPFATRYATLVWVAGSEATPVNQDWVYAYRAPTTMLRARRIPNPNLIRRAFDPNPIEFRVGSDDTGAVIYTNQLDPDLEYTVRPACAATAGDALFRAALAWKHAASLAPTLSRDEKKVAFCVTMFERVLGTAETAAAQEMQQAPQGDADWISGRS